MISVIVPVYNVEPYLRKCIDSILAQTYRDFELILIDDGSPDNCGAICDEYAAQDSRIRVIHQGNCGVSVARNTGLDAAKGEYVSFVDSDDWIDNEYLEHLYRLLVNFQAQISSCRAMFCTDMTGHVPDRHNVDTSVVLNGNCACVQPYLQDGLINVAPWGKLYVRQLWDGVRFPVGKIHEDQAVVPIVLYKAKKVAVSQEKLYFYRIVENSIMHKPFSLKRYDDIEAVENCIAFFESRNEHEIAALARKQHSQILAVYSIYARKSGIYDELPKKYRMPEWKALRILRKNMSDDKYTYYLAMIHPNWLRPHAYLRKIKKILHIPCK